MRAVHPRRPEASYKASSHWKSLRYALHGLRHAIAEERNIRIFLICLVPFLILCAWLKLLAWEWAAVLLAAAAFLAIELLNTAIERLTDAVDELHRQQGVSFHQKLKLAKDVASSASLLGLIGFLCVVGIVLWPYVNIYILK